MKIDFQNIAELYCSKFGFNIIRLSGKEPYEKSISVWFEKNRSILDLKKLGWESKKITGIAVIIKKDLLIIDFDKVNDLNIVYAFLLEIGLSKNYKWIVKSGSGVGFHVFVRVKNKENIYQHFGYKNYINFSPKNSAIVDHIEVRLNNCYIVLAPSVHPITKYNYEYINGFPDGNAIHRE